MNPASTTSSVNYGIGIDVGGTKVAGGIIDTLGRVFDKQIIPTRAERGGREVLKDVLALLQELTAFAKTHNRPIAAVGLAICELVGTRGEILSSQTIDWSAIPVLDELRSFAPARIEADSRAAAFCEARCGAGQSYESFLFVTVGTGIGSSFVMNGVPWVGARGCTGTLATAPMTILCNGCGRPSSAVVEEIASGSALVARYNKQAHAATARAEQVLAAALTGDLIAIEVIETAAQVLGATIGLLVNVLDPAAVVIGGGLGSARSLYWNRLVPSVRDHIWSPLHRGLPLLQAQQQQDGAFIGAALMALANPCP